MIPAAEHVQALRSLNLKEVLEATERRDNEIRWAAITDAANIVKSKLRMGRVTSKPQMALRDTYAQIIYYRDNR